MKKLFFVLSATAALICSTSVLAQNPKVKTTPANEKKEVKTEVKATASEAKPATVNAATGENHPKATGEKAKAKEEGKAAKAITPEKKAKATQPEAKKNK